MHTINKWRRGFLLETFTLFLSIKGRINFLQLARYGEYTELRYRQQFEKRFDFLRFNITLVEAHGSGNYFIAIDPSFVSKSGKHTPGAGYFWSGQAGKAKHGLEILGIAAIDLDNHTGFHLEAIQTFPGREEGKSLVDLYASAILDRTEELQEISKLVVADAWFAKNTFIHPLKEAGFEVISRFRGDADMKYLYQGPQKGGPGRPKQYDGKVCPAELNMDHFQAVGNPEGDLLHTAVVYSVSLQMKVRLVHLEETTSSGKPTYKLFFSTDTTMDAAAILHAYRSRFQIEFLYRDAKQHTALEHCQARSENKLHFHFNAALSSINIAKVAHWLCLPKQDRPPFSLCDIKTVNHNMLMMDRFFSMFGIDPNSRKNQPFVKELIYYGTRAA